MSNERIIKHGACLGGGMLASESDVTRASIAEWEVALMDGARSGLRDEIRSIVFAGGGDEW